MQSLRKCPKHACNVVLPTSTLCCKNLALNYHCDKLFELKLLVRYTGYSPGQSLLSTYGGVQESILATLASDIYENNGFSFGTGSVPPSLEALILVSLRPVGVSERRREPSDEAAPSGSACGIFWTNLAQNSSSILNSVSMI